MSNPNCCPSLESVLSPRLFKALGDPTRLGILVHLATQAAARPVTDIAACCTVDLSVVSRHLTTLRDAGIVEARRAGRQVLYEARCDVVAQALRRIADALDACCPTPVSAGCACGNPAPDGPESTTRPDREEGRES